MKLGYTTILHEPRLELKITCNEYCLSDMIYRLSTNPLAPVRGWCSASQSMIGGALGISRQSVSSMIKKLSKIDLIIKSDSGKLLKSGDTWVNVVVNFNFKCKESLHSVKKVDSQESLHPVKKVYTEVSRKFTPESKESLHNNNKDNNTINKELNGKLPLPNIETVKEVSFTDFWDAYKYKRNKKTSLKSWKKLTTSDKADALKAIPAYLAYIQKFQITQCHASSWLNARRWEDDNSIKAKPTNGTAQPDTTQGPTQEQAKEILKELYGTYKNTDIWNKRYSQQAKTNYCEALKLFYRYNPKLKTQYA